MSDRKIFGLSPGTFVTLSVLVASGIGEGFVMREKIHQLEIRMNNSKNDADRVHAIILDITKGCR